MISMRILGTGSALPERKVDNAELASLAGVDPARIRERTRIETRHWAHPGSKMAPLAALALRRALEMADISAGALRRIVLVTSTSGDHLTPATSGAVAHELGLSGTCDTFDLNNACLGFLSALDIGARCVATGLAPVGVVAVELMSAFVTKDDPRPWAVFGDAAAAVVLGEGRPGEGLVGAHIRTDGSQASSSGVRHPRFSGKHETVHFAISNREMSDSAMGLMVESANAALSEASLTIADIDWVLPHQPNGVMFEGIVKALGVDPARTVPVVAEIGSVAAASIPISLDRLFRVRRVEPGARILMVGVGSGVSYGALIHRVGG